MAYERIYQYCKAAGYKKEDIIITETDERNKVNWPLALKGTTYKASLIFPEMCF